MSGVSPTRHPSTSDGTHRGTAETSQPLNSRLMAVFFLASALIQAVIAVGTPADQRPQLWLPVTVAYAALGGWALASQHRPRHPATMALLILVNLGLLSALVLSSEPGMLTAPWSFLFLWDIPFIWAIFRARERLLLTAVQAGPGVYFLAAELEHTGSAVAPRHGVVVYIATALVLGWCTRAIVLAMRGAQLRTEQLVAEAEYAALHDPLTGLGNRATYGDRFAAAVAHSARTGTDVAVMLMDLDQFKLVNDSLGHPVGDALLVAVADRMVGSLRGSDSVARLGGDEFVVVMEGVRRPADAMTAAAHLQDSFRDAVVAGGNELFVTMSIGVTVVGGRDVEPADALREADVAMYRAKRRGRGMVEFYDETLRDAVTRQLHLEIGLRRALHDAHGFTVAYQPLVEAASGRVVGAEALARWRSPDLGDVEPAEFIPLAENSGLVVPLGAEVLDHALATVARWRLQHPDLTVAVNVSPHQLQRGDFAAQVRAALDRHGVAPSALTLEVTEGVALSDDQGTSATVTALARLGVRFALDDFGTGYSSIAALRRLPLSQVKVDRRLHADEPVLRACLDLGRVLGLTVVAEGIETVEAHERVRRLGYDLAQGYRFGRPMPADALDDLLRRTADPASAAHADRS